MEMSSKAMQMMDKIQNMLDKYDSDGQINFNIPGLCKFQCQNNLCTLFENQ